MFLSRRSLRNGKELLFSVDSPYSIHFHPPGGKGHIFFPGYQPNTSPFKAARNASRVLLSNSVTARCLSFLPLFVFASAPAVLDSRYYPLFTRRESLNTTHYSQLPVSPPLSLPQVWAPQSTITGRENITFSAAASANSSFSARRAGTFFPPPLDAGFQHSGERSLAAPITHPLGV